MKFTKFIPLPESPPNDKMERLGPRRTSAHHSRDMPVVSRQSRHQMWALPVSSECLLSVSHVFLRLSFPPRSEYVCQCGIVLEKSRWVLGVALQRLSMVRRMSGWEEHRPHSLFLGDQRPARCFPPGCACGIACWSSLCSPSNLHHG